MFPINIFLFFYFRKHFCGNKIYFLGSKNVSRQTQNILIVGFDNFPTLFQRKKNIVFRVNNILSCVGANVFHKMFPIFCPHQET